jgi:hypothetical protein
MLLNKQNTQQIFTYQGFQTPPSQPLWCIKWHVRPIFGYHWSCSSINIWFVIYWNYHTPMQKNLLEIFIDKIQVNIFAKKITSSQGTNISSQIKIWWPIASWQKIQILTKSKNINSCMPNQLGLQTYWHPKYQN